MDTSEQWPYHPYPKHPKTIPSHVQNKLLQLISNPGIGMSWVQTVPISGEGCSSSSTWSADQRLCCRFSKKKENTDTKTKTKTPGEQARSSAPGSLLCFTHSPQGIITHYHQVLHLRRLHSLEHVTLVCNTVEEGVWQQYLHLVQIIEHCCPRIRKISLDYIVPQD